jgi:hypothetical protein
MAEQLQADLAVVGDPTFTEGFRVATLNGLNKLPSTAE